MKFFYENRKNEIVIQERRALSFYEHLHSQLEMVFLKKGRTRAYSSSREILVEEGDFFISFPNSIHAFEDEGEVEAIIFFLPDNLFPEYKAFFDEHSPAISVAKGVDEKAVELVLTSLKYEGDKFEDEIKRALVSALMGMVLENITILEKTGKDADSVQAVLSYLYQNYKKSITLDTVSNELFISKSRLSHIFSEKIGIPFRDFLNEMRLKDAEDMLTLTNMTITEIALQSGFDTTRTFNRAFKKKFSLSPVEYRKREKLL